MTEDQVYQVLLPDLQKVLDRNWMPQDELKLEKRKLFYAIVNGSSLVARLKLSIGKTPAYIELPYSSVEDLVANGIGKKQKDEMARILIPDTDDIVIKYREAFLLALEKILDQYPKKFDCCSRYEACSDAKQCVHPDRHFSADCGYRKILRSGKIFMGKNRNV